MQPRSTSESLTKVNLQSYFRIRLCAETFIDFTASTTGEKSSTLMESWLMQSFIG